MPKFRKSRRGGKRRSSMRDKARKIVRALRIGFRI